MEGKDSPERDTDIAIVGMSVRVPGATHYGQFWDNLRQGVESVRRYDDDELLRAGVARELLQDPRYVKAGAPLDEMEWFDAEFFGFSPKEGAIMDPQHRHFLECAWEALEDAGHPPERFHGAIGVFAGCGMGAYFAFNILTNRSLVDSVGLFLLRHTGNDKDFLASRVSYTFDLRGPSLSVQTACSTSLVAVHLACQSLLSGECDLALAGGVTIELPHRQGYLYQEGEILSADGHCRAFDHRSQGTLFGSGAGVVVLRRLADALADGDSIHAVVKGTAVNNDGSGKVGYLAPSVDGQAAAVAEALAVAGITADTVSFLECHGTGTPVGDPIEITALTQAFRRTTRRSGFCGIGSVKTNIGHLDTAAGVASLAKAALALEHELMPASLGYEAPNPHIDFPATPFFVVDAPRPWPRGRAPRRAGVNSLGVGGTNAHAVLEEAPLSVSEPASRSVQLLVLSARSSAALDAATGRLAEHLKRNPDNSLADVAHTLQVGRRAFRWRRALACSSVTDALNALEARDPSRLPTQAAPDTARQVAFLFPGGGAQYPDMARELYESEAAFRGEVSRCLELLGKDVPDLERWLYPADTERGEASAALERPAVALPALFITEYALARLLMGWGLRPAAMLGHSLGEYTAACLAGVFSLEDALALVRLRGQLFERLPAGGMLSVALPPAELEVLLGPDVSIAAVNGPGLCVASGAQAALQALERTLRERDVECQRIHINVAAHSPMVEPILAEFAAFTRRLALKPPAIPFLSNVTGTWITDADATDPGYWVRHLRSTVRFEGGLSELLGRPELALVEVGPGRALGGLVRAHPGCDPARPVVAAIRHVNEPSSDVAFVLGALGRLWMAGVPVEWSALHAGERRRRLPLPSYPWQRRRCWIEPGEERTPAASAALEKKQDIADWFYYPCWKPAPLAEAAASGSEARWLVFVDACGLGQSVAAAIRARGDAVTIVHPAARFAREEPGRYGVRPGSPEDHDRLLAELAVPSGHSLRIVHAWNVVSGTDAGELHEPDGLVENGFFSLMALGQSLGKAELSGVRVLVLSNGLQQVAGEAVFAPERATLIGPVRVIPHELPGVDCRSVDLGWPVAADQEAVILQRLLAEFDAPVGGDQALVAYRGHERLVQGFESVRLGGASSKPRLRERGVYLITGGLGGIGLTLAEHLGRKFKARLALLSRAALPPRAEWNTWLDKAPADERTARRIRRIQEIEAAGGEVLVLAADVTRVEEVEAAIEATRRQFGGLNGIVHAAGVLQDGSLLLKSRQSADGVLAPKVKGTLALAAASRACELDFMVLFSSVSALTGLVGQVDYTAANAFLDAFARSRTTGDDGWTVAVNWNAWQEVGMAAELAGQLGIDTPAALPAGRETGHPVLRRCIRESPDERVYAGLLSAERDWLVGEHRVRGGHPLIPGAGHLELVRAALEDQGQDGDVELRDATFLAPFVVPEREERELRLAMARSGDEWSFEILATANGTREAWQPVAAGRAARVAREPAPGARLSEIAARCTRRARSFDGPELPHLAVGPRWGCRRHVSYGVDEALVSLELPDAFAATDQAFKLHPAMLDMATAGALELVPGYDAERDFYVPFSYGRLRLKAGLPSGVRSHVRHRAGSGNSEMIVFQVTIYDESGALLADIADFTMRRVADPRSLAGPPAPARTATANPILELTLRTAIRPAEGMEAFERVLSAAPSPQVIVSSQDLGELIERARPMPGDHGPGGDEAAETAQERPGLANPYVAPETPLQREIAAVWQEVLGIDAVGIHDDFFDLGGHSLLLTQVASRVRKRTRTELPLRRLFERRTVAGLAEEIEQARRDAPAPVSPTLVRVARDAYRTTRAALADDAPGRDPR